jgi:hypothetical protein
VLASFDGREHTPATVGLLHESDRSSDLEVGPWDITAAEIARNRRFHLGCTPSPGRASTLQRLKIHKPPGVLCEISSAGLAPLEEVPIWQGRTYGKISKTEASLRVEGDRAPKRASRSGTQPEEWFSSAG